MSWFSLNELGLCAFCCQWSRPRDIRCIKLSLSIFVFSQGFVLESCSLLCFINLFKHISFSDTKSHFFICKFLVSFYNVLSPFFFCISFFLSCFLCLCFLSSFWLFLCSLSSLKTWQKVWRKDWATWGGRSWTWRIKWSVSKIKGRSCWKNRKFVERQWKRKEEHWPTKSTVGLVIYEERMRDHHERRSNSFWAWPGRRTSPTRLKKGISQMTGASCMHLCKVLKRNKIHWKKMRRDCKKRWWSVGLTEARTNGETDTKRGWMKTTGETRP